MLAHQVFEIVTPEFGCDGGLDGPKVLQPALLDEALGDERFDFLAVNPSSGRFVPLLLAFILRDGPERRSELVGCVGRPVAFDDLRRRDRAPALDVFRAGIVRGANEPERLGDAAGAAVALASSAVSARSRNSQ